MSQHLALISKTQSLIAAGDISGAESALVELADAEGDHALMVVLEQLPPKDILAVIREYDTSKESVVNLLVSPEQFDRYRDWALARGFRECVSGPLVRSSYRAEQALAGNNAGLDNAALSEHATPRR